MKKTINLMIIILAVVLITGCSKKKLETYDEITYAEYREMIDNHETFPVVIGLSTCSACSLFKGTMDVFIQKYQVDVKYIDIHSLEENDYNSLKLELGFSSTPTTVFVINGEHKNTEDRIVGAAALSEVTKKYKEMGYIGE